MMTWKCVASAVLRNKGLAIVHIAVTGGLEVEITDEVSDCE